jgi:glycosyltransferase involved in cell wall biosynthesis
MLKKDMKIAIVHDFLVQYGGAERFLEVLSEMFPNAPIYTLLYDEEKMSAQGGPVSDWDSKDIRTSYLQKFPRFLRKHYQWLLPFFPVMAETFDLRDYDLVISSSSAWVKGIVTKLDTMHIAYLHSPMRFVWDYNEKYIKEISNFSRQGGTPPRRWQFPISNFLKRLVLSYIRVWDRLAADRPDYLVANSKYTQSRIQKYYRRNSAVIYPPAFSEAENNFQFPISNFQSNLNFQNSNSKINSKFNLPVGGQNTKYKIPNTEYFLIVSRLSPYKKVDLAIEAFNKLELPLVVIGEGKQKKYLQKITGKNVKILGWKDQDKLKKYYSGARAFIFPTNDDFGITMVEANSYGVPVIALKEGGAKEIIKEGENGLFFEAQTAEVLADGIRRFIGRENQFNSEKIKKSAERFGKERFKKEFIDFINSKLNIQ